MNHSVNGRAVKLGISGHAIDAVPAFRDLQLVSAISFRASDRMSVSMRESSISLRSPEPYSCESPTKAAIRILDRQDVDARLPYAR